MTFAQARNEIVLGLEAHIGCPVSLSDQIADQPDYPYCYYSVLAPRTEPEKPVKVTRPRRGGRRKKPAVQDTEE